MRNSRLISLSVLVSFGGSGLLGCSDARLHVGDDGVGGGHGGAAGSIPTSGTGGIGGGSPVGTGGAIATGVAGNSAGGTGAVSTGGSSGGATGTGGAAGSGLSVTPGSATFAGTLVESVSAPQTFTVRNDGSASTAVAALQGTNAAEFMIAANGCGATLQPGATCDFTVTFAPKIRSGSRSASLAVSGSSSPTANVSLSGTALPSLTLLAGGLGGAGYADGTGPAARFYYPTGVATDGAGDLFVTDDDNSVIRRIVIATGEVSTFAGTPHTPGTADGTGPAASFTSLQSITSDGAGNLFVVDGNSVRKIVIATAAVTTIADSISSSAYPQLSGIASDGAGYLYVADNDGTTGTTVTSIQKVSIETGAVTTIADRMGYTVQFDSVSDLVSDGAGKLYVAEGSVIDQVDIATGAVTTLAGAFGTTSIAPVGITRDDGGNLYFTGLNSVQKLVIATGAVTTLAGAAGMYGSADGTGTAARFSSALRGITSDGAGNLFVADFDSSTIREVDLATGTVTTLAGLAHEPGGAADGTGAAARFSTPGGIAGDGAGNLFVTDRDYNTIRKIVIATATVTTFAGAVDQTNGWADGTGAAARFFVPSDITADGAGNLFVADAENSTIRKIAIATRAVSTLAGGAGLLSGSTDGIGTAARFDFPYGVASDGMGNLYVADSSNSTIRKIVVATRAVTTIAGVAGQSGSADGTGTAARFYWPNALASDGAGNLYVSDTGNGTIRKVVVATGAVITLAGKAGETTGADGVGTAARFTGPAGITSDGAGNLYVADASTIRKIALDSATVSTVVGTPGRSGLSLGALPASLNGPYDVAVLPTGELAIVDCLENVVVIAHL